MSPLDKTSGVGNAFDWDAARSAYLEALTLGLPSERDAALARTFETLGHVMHLVQDLAVPAHVRNDFQSHTQYLNPFAGFGRWTENGFERFVRLNPELVGQAATSVRDVPFQALPVTRFWDRDLYAGGTPSDDRANDWGLAEYTNANFASQYTILTESFPSNHPKAFPYPRASSTNLQEVVTQALAPRAFIAEDSKVDLGFYIAKTADGETIENFARLGYLWSDIPADRLRDSLQLDDVVHRDYAGLLLPKAISYSRGILDYFFRGKLDVDLVPAPGEAPGGGAVVQLTGTNASEERLDGGTLELHWERLSTGERFRATPLDASAAVTADPSAPVQSARFEIPAEAERFVAVYKGALGREVPPPDSSAPGAVIGKVFGGERVEELYAADGRWWLRTPDGIDPLPILAGWTAGTIEELRWGDADNTLVGRTAFGRRGEPNRFFAWKIKRPEGSVAVPRTATGEVDVELLDETGFTFGGLVTTVRLSHTVHYRRYQPAYIWTAVYGYLPNVAGITPIREDGVELDNRLVDSGTVQLTDHPFPITLDLDKFWNSGGPSHAWWLERIGYRRDGRIVALVSVWLTNTNLTAPVTVRRYQRPCQTWPCPIEEVPGAVGFRFPDNDTLLMALIDVKTGEVIMEGGQRASTAPEIMSLEHTTNRTAIGGASTRYDPIGFIAVRHEVAQDGERYVVESNYSYAQEFYTYACSPPATTVELGTVDHEYGTIAASSGGAGSGPQALLYPPRIAREQLTERLCVRDMIRWGFNLPPLVITRKTDAYTAFFNTVEDVGRSRSSPERLAILVSRRQGVSQSGFVVQPRDWRLITWDPGTSTATVRDERGAGEALSVSLAGTARENAVVSTVSYPAYDYRLVVVPLEGTASPTSAPIASTASSAFTALEPGRVYNTSDTKFYRTRPALEPTALPRALAGGGSLPAQHADYHTVIVK